MSIRTSTVRKMLELLGLSTRKNRIGVRPAKHRTFLLEPLERRELLSVCTWTRQGPDDKSSAAANLNGQAAPAAAGATQTSAQNDLAIGASSPASESQNSGLPLSGISAAGTYVPPSVTMSGPATVAEGSPYKLTLGSVVESGQDTVSSYTINWGDGQESTYTAAQIAALDRQVTHTYADGPSSPQITGTVTDANGTYAMAVAGGALNPAFGTGGMVTTARPGDWDSGTNIAEQDGEILVAGNVLQFDMTNYVYTNYAFSVTRYNADGSVDTSFGPKDTAGVAAGVATVAFAGEDAGLPALAVQADGSILVAGSVGYGSSAEMALVRLDASGDLDTSFGTGGETILPWAGADQSVPAMAIDASGNIVVAAAVATGQNYAVTDFQVVRFLPNGTLDTSFGTGGIVTTAFPGNDAYTGGVAIQSNGDIIVSGSANNGSNYQFALACYNPDGSLNQGFGVGGEVTTGIGSGDASASAVAVQADGKIVAAGSTNESGVEDFALARYNPDGSLDTSFGAGGEVLTAFPGGNAYAFNLMIQPDGKLVAMGQAYNGSYDDFALARYNTDGSLDQTFGVGGEATTDFGEEASIGGAVWEADGTLVAAGTVTTQAVTTGTAAPQSDIALASYLATTTSLPVSVTHVAPTITISGPTAVWEGTPYTLTLGPVVEPGPNTVSSYTIYWGDGQQSTYTADQIVQMDRQVTHVYDAPCTATISVDLTDAYGTYDGLADSAAGAITSDRFAYTGTLQCYATLADAEAGTNPISNGAVTTIGDSDVLLDLANGVPSFNVNEIEVMGMYYVDNDPQGFGPGWVQLDDSDNTSVTAASMKFENEVGGEWTEYTLNISGANEDWPNGNFSGFWDDPNAFPADPMDYISYNLSLTASGLQGSYSPSTGLIESTNMPTGVTGTLSAIMQNVSPGSRYDGDYFSVQLSLNMDNWSYANPGNNPYPVPEDFIAGAAPGVASTTVNVTDVVVPNTTINVPTGQTLTLSGLTGAGPLDKTGGGTLILTGQNTYTGTTDIEDGTLQLGDGAASNGSVAGDIADNAILTFANPSAETYSGGISGSGSLVADGPGALILAGSNGYTGGTTVGGGTLTLGSAAALPGSGLTTIGSGGWLELGGGSGIDSLFASSAPRTSSKATTPRDAARASDVAVVVAAAASNAAATPSDAATSITAAAITVATSSSATAVPIAATASNPAATPSEAVVPVAATTTGAAATPGAIALQQAIASRDAVFVFSGPQAPTAVVEPSVAASSPVGPTEAVRLAALAGVVAPSAPLSKSTAGQLLFHLPPKATMASGVSVETQRTTTSSIDAISASPSASGVATIVAPAAGSSLGPAVHRGRVLSAPRMETGSSVRLLAQAPNGLFRQGADDSPAGA